MRGSVPDSVLGEAGRLSTQAIAKVRAAQWPDPRDEHELHDLLLTLTIVPATVTVRVDARDWPLFLERLARSGRATLATVPCDDGPRSYWLAAERVAYLRALWPALQLAQPLPEVSIEVPPTADIIRRAVVGWTSLLGPTTAMQLADLLGLPPAEIWKALLQLEVAGTHMRGVFENYAPRTDTALSHPFIHSEGRGHPERSEGSAVPLLSTLATPLPDHHIEWCERTLLQRIHKRTLGALRREIEPIPPATYFRWLLSWQHLAPQTQLTGEDGLLEALRSLEGFEAPAIEWERALLPARVANYDPRSLDALCLAGVIGWGRISPHPAFASQDTGGPRRVVPTSMAPITFFLREEALWFDLCLQQRQISEPILAASLSPTALRLRSVLSTQGAVFSADFTRLSGLPAPEVSRALWELVAAGLATADGFDSLRVLIDPRRKQSSAPAARRTAASRNLAGRWCLLRAEAPPQTSGEAAELREAQLSSAAHMLLRRYGVLFRDLLTREATAPKWRDLLPTLRRMEARGEVRGGRFVSGFVGEQFALPEALDSLRAARRAPATLPPITLCAADPVNLVGTVLPGERTPAIAGKLVTLDPEAVTPQPTPATLLHRE